MIASNRWTGLSSHRLWLLGQADAMLSLFERHSRHPRGGFHPLADDGTPKPGPSGDVRGLHATARMVHCYAAAQLMGRPGAAALVDHGMDYLWRGHRDAMHGGYVWKMGSDGPLDDTKQAYGHAFVLLAAASAKVAGHPDADRLLTDAATLIHDRFWEDRHGAVAEQFTRDWQTYDGYRGQNSNMHLTEALMAAFEATADSTYLRMAERIADLIVNCHARANGWRLIEHFHSDWSADLPHEGNLMFRPYGSTPGHWLEWARLLVQLWELGGRSVAWLPDAARALFAQAVGEGWDHARGGFYYTIDWTGQPHVAHRYFWPCCEGIAAAAVLGAIDGAAIYEEWYRRIWDFSATHLIDHASGGWFPQLDDDLLPARHLGLGKPDLYHALQACLIPLLPSTGSITAGLRTTGLRI